MAKILIAESNETMRSLLKALIESHPDWQVCGEAVDGLETVAKAAELKPDLILLDLSMPLLDGFRVAREVSTQWPEMPILLYTHHDLPELALEARKYGIREVIGKHESAEKLLSTIEAHLSAKDQISEVLNDLGRSARPKSAKQGSRATADSEDDKFPPEVN
jgi:DNA-binding NarL/FixJ family response regulator